MRRANGAGAGAEGHDARERRSDRELCSGPGKLTQALGITLEENGGDLSNGPVLIRSRGEDWLEPAVVEGTRVGITRRHGLPWRFCARETGTCRVRGRPAPAVPGEGRKRGQRLAARADAARRRGRGRGGRRRRGRGGGSRCAWSFVGGRRRRCGGWRGGGMFRGGAARTAAGFVAARARGLSRGGRGLAV